uniref:Transmembrane protein 171 n=1 Tax=Latimeria chalumnae TaxID=7897 RepID=H3ALX4_LATCH
MIPVVTTAPQMAESGGPTNKCGFFLCTFGAVCVSVGIFLLILGFWSCHPEELGSCYMVLKIGGPSLAAFGVGSIILARFKTRLYLRRRQLEDEQVDLDTFLFCGENRPFSCLVITGFLCLIGGILITLIKFLVPGCEVVLQNQFINGKLPPNVESRVCGFLPMQILGAAIAFLGLCFFVVACFKRRQAPSGTQENLSVMEDGGFQASESFQVVVGNAIVTFPPPPPSYFTESPPPGGSRQSHPSSGNPPSYCSIYQRSQTTELHRRASLSDQHSIYTIPLSDRPAEITAPQGLPSEVPPRGEGKGETGTDSFAPP